MEEAPRKSFRRCTDVEEGNVSPSCAGKGSEAVPRVKTGMTGRSCNEVPVSLGVFHQRYRIIGEDARAAIENCARWCFLWERKYVIDVSLIASLLDARRVLIFIALGSSSSTSFRNT